MKTGEMLFQMVMLPLSSLVLLRETLTRIEQLLKDCMHNVAQPLRAMTANYQSIQDCGKVVDDVMVRAGRD